MQTIDIEELNAKPLLEAEDFIILRVGLWDQFSGLDWNALVRRLLVQHGMEYKPVIMEIVNKFAGDTKSQRSAFRWLLRGLKLNHVIIKCRYDLAAKDYYKENNNETTDPV